MELDNAGINLPRTDAVDLRLVLVVGSNGIARAIINRMIQYRMD